MKSLLLFTIFVILFGSFGFSELRARESNLSGLTCQEYWDYHEVMVDIKAPNREERSKKYSEELKKLWDYEYAQFKQKNPDLFNNELEQIGETPFYIMTIYNACEMRPENMNRKIGDRLQETLLLKHVMANQKERAKKNGCNVMAFRVDNIRTLPTQKQGTQYLCIKEGWKKMLSKTGESGLPLGVDGLPAHCFLYGDQEECIHVTLSNENECLGLFGLCQKNADGDCSWEKTERSAACVEHKSTKE